VRADRARGGVLTFPNKLATRAALLFFLRIDLTGVIIKLYYHALSKYQALSFLISLNKKQNKNMGPLSNDGYTPAADFVSVYLI
jgi:hypothetical protein